MSLTVYSNQKAHSHLKNPTTLFSIGDRKRLDIFLESADVHKVVATDEILLLIKSQMTNIPMCDNDSMAWFGDHSKFIAYHLKF